MKNKILYYICKVICFTNLFILILVLTYYESQRRDDAVAMYCILVIFGNVSYAYSKFRNKKLYDRIFYEIWYFLGYLGAELIMLLDQQLDSLGIDAIRISATTSQKVTLTIICIIMLSAKIYKMYYETDKYMEGEEERHNRRVKKNNKELDAAILKAASDIEHAQTRMEQSKAEARMERAKLMKERYYVHDRID